MTQGGPTINPNWILLDSESTVDIFNNRNLVSNIRQIPPHEILRCHGTGRFQDTTHKADLLGYQTVWFNPHSIANIFSLANLITNAKVVFDSEKEHAFIVTTANRTMKFVKSKSGLFYHDIRWSSKRVPKPNFSLVNTVNDNKSNYSTRQLENANKAWDLYELVGCLSHRDFL
jgi:hypothetical protein